MEPTKPLNITDDRYRRADIYINGEKIPYTYKQLRGTLKIEGMLMILKEKT